MNLTASAEVIHFDPHPQTRETHAAKSDAAGLWLAEHLRELADITQRRSIEQGTRATVEGGRGRGPLDTAANLDAASAIYRLLAAQPGRAEASLSDCLGHASAAVMDVLDVRERSNFTYYCEPSCLIPSSHAFAVGAIAVEAMANALEHAHPAGVLGDLSVACCRVSNGLLLEVADDGVGLPEGFDAAHDGGIGLEWVRRLAERIGAQAELVSAPLGFTFRLTLVPAAA
jgi:two-component sensor histidine kinase